MVVKSSGFRFRQTAENPGLSAITLGKLLTVQFSLLKMGIIVALTSLVIIHSKGNNLFKYSVYYMPLIDTSLKK
jgi:hypothetical protein